MQWKLRRHATPDLAGQLDTIYGNFFTAAGKDPTFNGGYMATTSGQPCLTAWKVKPSRMPIRQLR